MQSYFISISGFLRIETSRQLYEDGDSWDYEYQWVCEEPSPKCTSKSRPIKNCHTLEQKQ